MTNWQEQAAISEWLLLKSSAEHYEAMLAHAETAAHSHAEFWAIEWRKNAQDKRRRMALILDAMPTAEERMKEAA